jgi:type I restriction enzyme, S subunit
MGEVGRWIGGGTPSKANSQFWTGGTIPWVSPKDMKSDVITDAQDHITDEAVANSATNLIDASSVLVVVRSGILQHTLAVAVTQRVVALNQDLKAVKPRNNVCAEYLALAQAVQSTMPRDDALAVERPA